MQEGVEATGKFVVSSCDTPELLEAIEESLDEISRLVAMPVDLARRIPVAARRDDGLSTVGLNSGHVLACGGSMADRKRL